jgi:hypothetical protein
MNFGWIPDLARQADSSGMTGWANCDRVGWYKALQADSTNLLKFSYPLIA